MQRQLARAARVFCVGFAAETHTLFFPLFAGRALRLGAAHTHTRPHARRVSCLLVLEKKQTPHLPAHWPPPNGRRHGAAARAAAGCQGRGVARGRRAGACGRGVWVFAEQGWTAGVRCRGVRRRKRGEARSRPRVAGCAAVAGRPALAAPSLPPVRPAFELACLHAPSGARDAGPEARVRAVRGAPLALRPRSSACSPAHTLLLFPHIPTPSPPPSHAGAWNARFWRVNSERHAHIPSHPPTPLSADLPRCPPVPHPLPPPLPARRVALVGRGVARPGRAPGASWRGGWTLAPGRASLGRPGRVSALPLLVVAVRRPGRPAVRRSTLPIVRMRRRGRARGGGGGGGAEVLGARAAGGLCSRAGGC